MRLFAQTLDLVDDPQRIAEYIEHHRAVWPEVLQGLHAVGIRSMRIWRLHTRLFMIVETDDDFDPKDYERYADDPKARQWEELMRRYQCRAPGADPNATSWWSPMEEIFDLREQQGAIDA